MGKGRKEDGVVGSGTGAVVVRQRKKSRMERKEMKEGGKEDGGERAGGGLPKLQTAQCFAWGKWSEVLAPQLAPPPPPPPPAPISGSFSLSSSHTLLCFPREPDSTAGLIKPREAERQKKDGEGKRGHTTGRHQLKPCSLLFLFFFFGPFFPFISRFMIEFLTNTLVVHWVQTHSKKLLFDSTSLRTL